MTQEVLSEDGGDTMRVLMEVALVVLEDGGDTMRALSDGGDTMECPE